MLGLTRKTLQVLLVLNWIAAIGLGVFAASLILGPDLVTARLVAKFGAEADAVRYGLIGIAGIGVAVAVPVHLIFTRLIAMIDTVRTGQPFVAANAVRLRNIAWAMLAIQCLDLAFGWVAWRLGEAAGEAIGWQFSVSGWLAVLLLFVLARVFQQGAAMQDEIEGTV